MQKLIIPLLLVVIAVGGFFLFRFLDEGDSGFSSPAGGESGSGADSREGLTARRHADGSEAGAASTTIDPAAAGEGPGSVTAGITGLLVRRSDGQPVAGVETVYRDAAGAELARAMSDDEGRFALALAGPRPAGLLAARGAGLALEPKPVAASAIAELLDLGRLELDPAVVITGRVVDEKKKPVAGALVELFPHEKLDLMRYDIVQIFGTVFSEERSLTSVTTDEKGMFRIEEVPARHWILLASAKDRSRRYSKPVEALVGVPAEVEIVLGPPFLLAGTVKDEQGKPIVGARVVVLNPMDGAQMSMRSFKTASDAAGKFRFEGLSAGYVQVLVRAPGHIALGDHGIQLPAENLEIVMGPSGRLSGRVRDRQSDSGIAGVEVIALQWESGCFEMTVTDSEGEFELSDVPRRGELYVIARKEGFSMPKSPDGRDGMFGMPGLTLQETELVAGESRVEITMVGGTKLGGRVYDQASGEGIAGAKVRYMGQGAFFGMSKTENVETRTDENGRYELTGVPPGGFVVIASARGYFMPKTAGEEDMFGFFGPGSETGRKLVAGQVLTDVDVALVKGVSVAGRVVGPDDEPVVGAAVYWLPETESISGLSIVGSEVNKAVTDQDGSFEFAGLPTAAKLRLTAQSKKFPSAESLSIELDLEGEKDVVIRMRRGGRVEGRLLYADGSPAPDIALRADLESGFIDFGFAMGMAGDIDAVEDPTVVTDGNGAFVFDNLPEGEVAVAIDTEIDQVLGKDSRRLNVRGGQTSRKVLKLEETASISGRVVDGEGRPVAEANVQAWAAPDSPTAEYTEHGSGGWAATDADGRFRVSRLMAGMNYTISVEQWEMSQDSAGEFQEMKKVGEGKLADVPGGAKDVVIVIQPPKDE